MDSKPTKSVGHFEENKFSVGGHQFLLECCSKLIKTYNFGQKAVNKGQFKNKNEQYCALGCLFSKLPRLLVDFLSMIVVIFYNEKENAGPPLAQRLGGTPTRPHLAQRLAGTPTRPHQAQRRVGWNEWEKKLKLQPN